MGSIVGKERVPVGVSPPSLTGRCNLGWLGHVGHRVVRLGQLVLDSVVGAECVVRRRAAVVSVAVPLAPSLEEDRQRAHVGLLHRLDKGQDVREDVVVDVLGAKAGPLTLVLQHHRVPVPVLDLVQAVVSVPVERLASRRTPLCGRRESGSLCDLPNHPVDATAASCVAVPEEENVLVRARVPGGALLGERWLLMERDVMIDLNLDQGLTTLTEWGQAIVSLESVSVGQVDSQ